MMITLDNLKLYLKHLVDIHGPETSDISTSYCIMLIIDYERVPLSYNQIRDLLIKYGVSDFLSPYAVTSRMYNSGILRIATGANRKGHHWKHGYALTQLGRSRLTGLKAQIIEEMEELHELQYTT